MSDSARGARQIAGMQMACPRCHTSDLTPKLREDVEIDVCGACRGVWLDRGELDKLIARASERDRRDDRDDDDDDDDDRRGGRRGGGRSWWDIFD